MNYKMGNGCLWGVNWRKKAEATWKVLYSFLELAKGYDAWWYKSLSNY